MNTVWNTLVNEVRGNYTVPVDIQLPTTRYDMGRAVGTFEAEDEAEEIQAAELATKPANSTERKASKADTVRELIRAAKEQGSTADTVIAQVVDALGFTRALAKAYVRNNWEKVAV